MARHGDPRFFVVCSSIVHCVLCASVVHFPASFQITLRYWLVPSNRLEWPAHLERTHHEKRLGSRAGWWQRPAFVVSLACAHIYKMDYKKLVDFHVNNDADLSIGALRVDVDAAQEFGVMEIQPDGRIIGFQEKPRQPRSIPGDPDHALASM